MLWRVAFRNLTVNLKEVPILFLYCGIVAITAQQEVKIQEATSVQEVATMLDVSLARSMSRHEDHSTNRLVRH